MQTEEDIVTADIEFLMVLSRTILQLMLLSGSAIVTVLVVTLVVWLFGGLRG
ncbi:hypothetical protein [Bradyrhizobium hipponense]|uniref:hypothetical protein n=1 Tax=Bradyrhizobium hipponense TaxID=2605638 RepID=UPI0016530899|nr:hypothetical protein [Bradyrhizobium hipponense]